MFLSRVLPCSSDGRGSPPPSTNQRAVFATWRRNSPPSSGAFHSDWQAAGYHDNTAEVRQARGGQRRCDFRLRELSFKLKAFIYSRKQNLKIKRFGDSTAENRNLNFTYFETKYFKTFTRFSLFFLF